VTLAFQGIGIGSSNAIALGPAFVDSRGQGGVTQAPIGADEVQCEIARFDLAVAAARRALKLVHARIPPHTPTGIAEFIEAHLLMLDDSTLVDEVRRIVAEQLCSAEWALQRHRDTLIAVFDQMDDPYLRTRREDIEQVVHQIQTCLRGEPSGPVLLERDLAGYVVVARDLTPADAILLHHRGAVAFVTEYGGPMSHTAILARSLGVPAVMGLHDISRYLRAEELLIVDGATGTVIANADAGLIDDYRQRRLGLEARCRRLRALVDRPSRTRDGFEIRLLANLELPEDIELAKANGALGVGLYRTEFLYMNRSDLPDEEEHLANYSAMLADLDGRPITIRTLDLGVDKHSEALARPSSNVSNPALGLRAIRLCLKEPALFRPQVRAILRASALGPVRLMLPLVTSVHELDRALAIIAELKRQLDRDGLAYDDSLPVGAMIEVPAAALTRAPSRAGWIFCRSGPMISSSTPWPSTVSTTRSTISSTRSIRPSCVSSSSPSRLGTHSTCRSGCAARWPAIRASPGCCSAWDSASSACSPAPCSTSRRSCWHPTPASSAMRSSSSSRASTRPTPPIYSRP
jgi:phosphoenolpyruvate-protein phosphotransferase (PTS system enzyme I)